MNLLNDLQEAALRELALGPLLRRSFRRWSRGINKPTVAGSTVHALDRKGYGRIGDGGRCRLTDAGLEAAIARGLVPRTEFESPSARTE